MLRPFDYYAPRDIKEVSKLLNEEESYVLAGGTDLIVKIRGGWPRPKILVDIKKLEWLNEIKDEGKYISIGCLATVNQILKSELLRGPYECLREAGAVFGCHEIRNRATFGGSVAHASPGAETGCTLFVIEPMIRLQRYDEVREVPIKDFWIGVNKTSIKKDEILTHILLPKFDTEAKSAYVRRARTRGMDLAGVNVSVLIKNPKDVKNREIRIAMGAVTQTPLRALEVEEMFKGVEITDALLEKAKKRLAEIINPRPTSLRATPEYKKAMVGYMTEQCIRKILEM